MKHTKGPYTQFLNAEKTHTIMCADGFVIAIADGAVSATEDEANAKLFAAAPTMLEALKEAEEQLVNHHEIGYIRRAYEQRGGSCEVCHGTGILDKVTAAIKLATGE